MKTDISIKKQMTINTGNYSSVQPSVEITLKDVDIERMHEIHKDLNIITSALFLKELETLVELQSGIQEIGTKKFLQSLDENQIKIDFKQSIKNISDNEFTI